MAEDPTKKPKLIVDDDWKERVQAEKEELQKKAASGAEKDVEASGESAEEPQHAIPPASFPLLVSSLATQALMALGQIAETADSKPVVQPDVAKHHIDMLGILEEKTAGNLTAEESNMLTGALHELRMLFVSVRK